MQINPNLNNRDYFLKLARHEIEPTLERLNALDWKQVGKALPNSDEYVHLSNTHSILQDKADKIAEAKQAEDLKQANMNKLQLAFYKSIQKPVTQWWGNVKPKEKELPPVRENWNRGVNLFND
jgi:hypothetical protein